MWRYTSLAGERNNAHRAERAWMKGVWLQIKILEDVAPKDHDRNDPDRLWCEPHRCFDALLTLICINGKMPQLCQRSRWNQAGVQNQTVVRHLNTAGTEAMKFTDYIINKIYIVYSKPDTSNLSLWLQATKVLQNMTLTTQMSWLRFQWTHLVNARYTFHLQVALDWRVFPISKYRNPIIMASFILSGNT